MSMIHRPSLLLAVPIVLAVTACQAGQTSPTTGATARATATPVASAAASAAATATPVATATPAAATKSSAPAATAPGSLSAADVGHRLSAGRHEVGTAFAQQLSFEVPDGFGLDAIRDGNVTVSSPQGQLGAFIPEAVYPDPCGRKDQPLAISRANQLVGALRNMKGFTASEAAVMTIDGRRVWAFDLSNDIETSTAGCARDLMLPLFISRGNPQGEATNGRTHQRLWVVDGKHGIGSHTGYEGPVLIVADGWTTAADLAVLEGIARSVKFE